MGTLLSKKLPVAAKRPPVMLPKRDYFSGPHLYRFAYVCASSQSTDSLSCINRRYEYAMRRLAFL
jgi:hypothetical protein